LPERWFDIANNPGDVRCIKAMPFTKNGSDDGGGGIVIIAKANASAFEGLRTIDILPDVDRRMSKAARQEYGQTYITAVPSGNGLSVAAQGQFTDVKLR
jgi:hypothetical protein